MKTLIFRNFIPIVLIFGLGSCSNDTSNVEENTTINTLVTTYNYTTDELELARIINNYRISVELSELQLVNHISYVSQQHNTFMISNNAITHGNFTSRANNLMEVLGAVSVSENLAYNFSTPQATLNAWINSPEHKENLEGDFTHFGISISVDATGKKYYTTMFVKI